MLSEKEVGLHWLQSMVLYWSSEERLRLESRPSRRVEVERYSVWHRAELQSVPFIASDTFSEQKLRLANWCVLTLRSREIQIIQHMNILYLFSPFQILLQQSQNKNQSTNIHLH